MIPKTTFHARLCRTRCANPGRTRAQSHNRRAAARSADARRPKIFSTHNDVSPNAWSPPGHGTAGTQSLATRATQRPAQDASLASSASSSTGSVRRKRTIDSNPSPDNGLPSAKPPIALQARQKDIEQRLADIGRRYPDIQSSVKTYAHDYVQKNFGKDVDPEYTFLNRFDPPGKFVEPPVGSDEPAIGRSNNPHPAGTLREWRTLTDVFVHNFDPNYVRNDMGSASGKFGVYQDNDSSAAYPPAKQSLIDTGKLYDKMTSPASNGGNDFSSHYQQRLGEFWSGDGQANYAALQNDRALWEVDRQQTGAKKLSNDDYSQVKAVLDGDREGGKDTTVHPLDIGGFKSTNGLRMEDRNTGRNFLYLQGSDQPVRPFNSRQDAVGWIKQNMTDPKWAEKFADSYFSVNDAQGRTGNPGVAMYLKDQAKYEANQRHPVVGEDYGTHGEKYLNSREDIKADPFGKLAQFTKEGPRRMHDMTSTPTATIRARNGSKELQAYRLSEVPWPWGWARPTHSVAKAHSIC
jgi:hypothetical protein